ncbi:cation channel sperm-associated auxiliary subunit beta-like [Ptychodera flava]|uniref:cation channel sperm-associated auxiliary subunit beta-like n=1 Tax=Ptychodera flava TaxID=63121 RepID=UPI003969DD91
MLTVTLRHEVYFPGKVKVTVHLWQASLKCPKTSYTVTILCSCPPGKRLRYEYPYVISMEDYLHGNPKDDTFRKRPLLFDLEVNYRPPSKYGIAIPMSPHVYNVDPSKPIPRNMFQVSQESWRFKQCAGKQSQDECNCTDMMRYSNLAKYSDCKQRVYRVRQASGKLPLKFFLHTDEMEVLMTSPYVITLEEVNGREDYFVQNTPTPSLDAMISDDRLVNRSEYLDPNTAKIIMQGSGLYHFRAKVIPGFSYCELEDELQVFIDGAVLPYPLQMIVIVSVSILIGGFLFVIYLWYLHNHHTHRTIRIGSRCQKLH